MRRFGLRLPLLATWTAALAFQFLNLELQDKASESSHFEFSSQLPARTKVMEPGCEINRRAPQGGVFRTAIGQEPTSLNPLRPSDAYANAILAWTHEGLMVRDLCTNQWRPGLALSYSIEDEGRAYRIGIPQAGFPYGTGLEYWWAKDASSVSQR